MEKFYVYIFVYKYFNSVYLLQKRTDNILQLHVEDSEYTAKNIEEQECNARNNIVDAVNSTTECNAGYSTEDCTTYKSEERNKRRIKKCEEVIRKQKLHLIKIRKK